MCVARTGSYFEFRAKNRKEEESLWLVSLRGLKFSSSVYFLHTVTYTESGTPMLNWDSRYLCHFSTEKADIWSLGTSFEDVWTCKISALYLLSFQS